MKNEKIIFPPQLPLQFFRWFCHPDLLQSIEGDLIELYDEQMKSSGKRKADLQFIIDVLLLFRPGIIRPAEGAHHFNQYGMFKNYFKVGIRNILKYKVFSFINVFGLSTAMSVCMLIILMLADQKRYDAFHTKKDRIYRILSATTYATSPYPLAGALKAEYPIAEETTNLTPGIGGDVTYHQQLADMRGYFADPSFFRVFSFELEKGNKATALAAPRCIIITRKLAYQLFKDEDPMGKSVDFADRQLPFPQDHAGIGSPPVRWGSFTITGVFDETLYKSHLKFDVLMSGVTLQALLADKKIDDQMNSWEWYYRTYTYVLLRPDKDREDLAAALNDLVARKYANIKSEQTKGFKLEAQKLGDVQLDLKGNDTDNRLPRMGYYFLSFLAVIIMLSACLNYTNLSIARALTRAREIGVRKVTGASRKALVFQFLCESVITALLALAMAIILLFFVKRAFMSLWVNQYLNFELPSSLSVYIVFVGFASLIGILAGVYPAFHLSTYQPIQALKNLQHMRPGKLGMRKVLSISQFVISLFFITTSILIFNQFKYFTRFDYGFNSKDIVNIELQGSDYKKVSHELSSVGGVSAISATDIIPATGRSNGTQLKKAGSSEEYIRSSVLQTDENFMDNLGLKFVAGKNWQAGESSDRMIIVNEAAAKKLGYHYPAEIIGQAFDTEWTKEPFVVVGVVRDFRFNLLINRHEIEPLVLQNRPAEFKYVNVKIDAHNLRSTITELEAAWKRIDPIHPFKYQFFDDELAETHQGIFDVVSIISFIAFLAISIACLGLLGMATYTAERKTKEVGIRKVLGAEEFSIAVMLSKEFLKMLAIAIAVGAPLSYFINDFWLQKFPNRVEFGWGTLLLGIVILVGLGTLTIGSQTISASRRNPVEALKIE